MRRVVEKPGEVVGDEEKFDREDADAGEVGEADAEVAGEEEGEADEGEEGGEGFAGGAEPAHGEFEVGEESQEIDAAEDVERGEIFE